ncbi:ShlB/FhaC/HecB family hemolysin secretion/activation protein [Rivularia sp. PCC 7116]|uniref:ShlB/FhaC/HecB family hemolysin secretion/activation protein n=1 Tax=Rivularia sp. PCC 7116 TaxID=373994 RepID=UPI0002DD3A0C|nr:ShlB/FhaC/HecB family hemolysin secretion/activation protein [Rivularia sp. PCC 7116]
MAPELIAQAPNSEGDLNQERFPQAAPNIQPLKPLIKPELQPSTTIKEPFAETSGDRIQVNQIKIIGSTVFDSKDFEPIIRKVEGKSVTLEQLRKVADAITELYLKRDYITSRAILVNQKITDGIVTIRVIEGSLEKIEIQGNQRLRENYLRSRLANAGKKPLSNKTLEEQLRLLQFDPNIQNIEASLRAGSDFGKSILAVRVTENKPFTIGLGIDNYSPPSLGSERLRINTIYRNLMGIGDEVAASYYRSTRGGSNIFDFSYRVPLNPQNGTLQLRTVINNNKVVQPPFDDFDIRGESQLYDISYRQPLIRTPREEFALSLGFSLQNGQTFTFAGATPFGFGPDAEGNSRTRVVKFGQDYVRRDVKGAWQIRSLLSLGTGWFDATINSNPVPDARFFSWLGQLQRVQRLNKNNLLITQLDLQLTPNGLLPSQQFVIGGGQSIRGYRQNLRAGDNGVRFSIEDRITVGRDASGNPSLQVAPFFDAGVVWNVDDNPNLQPKQTFLAGAGIGILWQPIPKLNLKLDYGLPLVDLDDKGNNAQDEGFYFSVGYQL